MRSARSLLCDLKRKTLYVAFLGLCLSSVSWAAFDTYEFSTPQMQARFGQLSEELRCPKCQNQTIADSDAPIAKDLRRAIYEQLQQGRSDQEIVDFMVQRYGDFVRYKPPFTSTTWLLWAAPVLFLLAGLLLIGLFVRRKAGLEASMPLSDDELRRLQAVLPATACDQNRQSPADNLETKDVTQEPKS